MAKDSFNAPYELTKNQLTFCRAAVRAGLEIDFHYSGRGMDGKECPAIRVDRAYGVRPNEKLKTKATFSQDSMGLGVVLYARG